MNFRTHLILFLCIFVLESARMLREFGNAAPHVGDAIEVHNIGYNLAHGQGYRFDWDNPAWKRLLEDQNADGGLDFVLSRRSSHPTMFRPPLMPIIVAGVIRLFPQHSFIAWRVLDSLFFSIGACVLCEIAFIHASSIGLVAMLVMMLCDPLRRTFVPGWWTEGLAFDLICVIVWLMNAKVKIRTIQYNLIGGAAIGLLCLDRSVFVLMFVPLCVLLAISGTKAFISRTKSALTILLISVVIQSPWWIRNIEISHRFLPLGTQGGFNLPDEYGKVAMKYRVWMGTGMCDAWTPPTTSPADIPLPRGFTEKSFHKLWPGKRRLQALFAATFCESLDSEIAVSDRGKQVAWQWITSNYSQIPMLMLYKAEELTFFFHISFFVSGVIAMIAWIFRPTKRQILACLALFVAMYFAVISVTHVVWWRFLLPILPPTYVAIAIGVSVILERIFELILSRFLRRLL